MSTTEQKELLQTMERLIEKPRLSNLGEALDLVMEETSAERGCLWSEDRVIVYRGPDELRWKFPFSKHVVNEVLDRGLGLISFDALHDRRVASQSVKIHGIRSVLCAPVKSRRGEEPLGILYFDNQVSRGGFESSDLAFLYKVCLKFAKALTARKKLLSDPRAVAGSSER